MASRPLVLLATLPLLLVAAGGLNNMKPFNPSCSTTGNYTDGSQYKKNLDQLLVALPAAAGRNGWFFKGSVGSGADEVFALVMCFADRNETECLDCLIRAPAGITTVCPGSRNVSAAYDACVLRYSSAPIPDIADLRDVFAVHTTLSGVAVNSQALLHAWVPLFIDLSAGVTLDPLRISSSSTLYWKTKTTWQEMYGFAQCTRNLDAQQCRFCIKSYFEITYKLFLHSGGGAIKGYSCYLRYLLAPINITLPPAPAPTSSPPTKGVVIGVSVGSLSILILLGCCCICLILGRRRRRQQAREREQELREQDGEPDDFERGTGPKRFRYGELAVATDNFSDTHKLGEGGFGAVYAGFLKEMDLHVAIKRVSKASKQGRTEYASEVRIISRLRHRNLVQLIGWCHGGGELLLIYDLMPKGSLDKHLHTAGGSGTLLPWSARHDIVLGLGSALLYLHEECDQCVVHRDIKSSNVMLDAFFHAKLGDFGLARFVDHGEGLKTAVQHGTLGYMDPECMVSGTANVESDVYSFGVVLLEIACGRRPVVRLHGEEDDDVIHIVQWAWEHYSRGAILDAADARMKGQFDAREMETVMVVGLWSAHPDRSHRPSIRHAVNVLRSVVPVPNLPEKYPVATYVSPRPDPDDFYTTVPSGGVNSSFATTDAETAHLSLLHNPVSVYQFSRLGA